MEVSACHVMFVDVDDVMLVKDRLSHSQCHNASESWGQKFFEVNCQKEVREAPLLITQHTAAGQKQIAALCGCTKNRFEGHTLEIILDGKGAYYFLFATSIGQRSDPHV